MSIIERLFPPSELKALRESHYDPDMTFSAPNPKRRKMSDPSSSPRSEHSHTPGDSGYSSDESRTSPPPSTAQSPTTNKRPRTDFGDDTQKHVQPPAVHLRTDDPSTSSSSSNTGPTDPRRALIQSALFHRYLAARTPPSSATPQSSKRVRTQSDPASNNNSAQLALERHVLLARAKSRSLSASLAQQVHSQPATSSDPSPPSVTTTPTFLNSRLFDGLRLTSHERSLLHSLIPEDFRSSSSSSKSKSSSFPSQTHPRRREPDGTVDVLSEQLESRPRDQQNTTITAANVQDEEHGNPSNTTYSYPQRRPVHTLLPKVESSRYAGFAVPMHVDDDDESHTAAHNPSTMNHKHTKPSITTSATTAATATLKSDHQSILSAENEVGIYDTILALSGEVEANMVDAEIGVDVDVDVEGDGTGKVEDFFMIEEACDGSAASSQGSPCE